jgi:DNA-binding transcriptional regulator YhcF (GntR family)
MGKKKKPREIMDVIEIDMAVTTPVYKQIVHSIYKNIEEGFLQLDDPLPSVNKIAEKYSLARGSVFSAYNDLRASGIIDSIPGKGYYVSSTQINQKQNIFLLFSTFTPYKETLFNAILSNLPKDCSIDIYFHHHNIKVFENLIREQAGYYNRFVIMPEIHENTPAILSKLNPKQTYLLDIGYTEYASQYPGVYQNFEKDIYSILASLENLVKKYRRLFLVYPKTVKTTDIISGFKQFSNKKLRQAQVVDTLTSIEINKGDAFITIEDKHLVDLVNTARQNKWKLGEDIGILSYNESSLKSVIADGISTISTDFAAMGKAIAEMVTTGKTEVVENPFIMVDRRSF